MSDKVTVRWLGLAGLEIGYNGETVLIDPVFTRIPLMRAAFGRIAPDEMTVRGRVTRCSHIFITHAHYDHMLDAPLITRETGATLHAPPNACAIAAACGAPASRLDAVKPGKTAEAGAFSVRAMPSSHLRLPGFGYGRLPPRLAPPLRAAQYSMDKSLCYLIETGGFRLLAGPGLCPENPGRVDALLCCPLYLGSNLPAYVSRIRPRLFIPIHWEDMFRPAGLPPLPGIVPRFPFGRLDMDSVERQVRSLGMKYILPERGVEYRLDELLKL